MSLLLLTLSTKSISFLVLVIIYHSGLCYFSGISLRKLLKIFIEPLFVAIILLVIKSVQLSPLAFNISSFWENLHLALRILAGFSLFITFYFNTLFTEILALLNWLKIPLLLQELIYLSFRFIILLHQEIITIYISQKNRLGYTGFIKALISLKSLIKSSFLNALRVSELTLLAMHQRGFEYKNLVHSLSSLRIRDLYVLLLSISPWVGLWITL
ncbi:MAG: CbiQ family ECF transporter T component [Caldimicrobium sp.]|nr:CbiQ family ECF transporter T component [Caldimicrobium sp.]